MAFWIELHCDILSDGPPDPARHLPFCQSHRNESPGVMGRRSTPAKIAQRICTEAKRTGWVKTDRGWACPRCKTTLTPQK